MPTFGNDEAATRSLLFIPDTPFSADSLTVTSGQGLIRLATRIGIAPESLAVDL
jgi:hypothetical protein